MRRHFNPKMVLAAAAFIVFAVTTCAVQTQIDAPDIAERSLVDNHLERVGKTFGPRYSLALPAVNICVPFRGGECSRYKRLRSNDARWKLRVVPITPAATAAYLPIKDFA
jgi:hypothetical protein